MNNNVVEKTLKSIDNIDRLSDLAAISIYNTSHEAIDKFDIMQEHATPEYVEGEFVQESLLTGVLIGAGIIGVAISAFLIIKKIIESKAKGDPNAASNTPEGADLTKPEDIQKLFDKWKTEYFNKYPDLVVENVKCADARQMSEYATLMTDSVNQFTDRVNVAVDEYMDNGSEEKLIEHINDIAATIGGADISAALSSEGRIDQSTIGNLEVSAVAIAKSFKEFDGIIKNNIANFEKKAKEKNDKGTEEEGSDSRVSEKTIKQFSDILKKKAEETGKIMVSFRQNVLGGFEAAIKAAANEKASSQTKQQTGNGSNGLTDEAKQRILNVMKVYYPEDEKQIIDEINVFDAAESADELKEILDESYDELKPGKGTKNAFIRIAGVAEQVAAHKHFDWPIKADDYNLDRLDSEDTDDEADIDINAGGSGEGELKNQNTDGASAETEIPETENAEKKDETPSSENTEENSHDLDIQYSIGEDGNRKIQVINNGKTTNTGVYWPKEFDESANKLIKASADRGQKIDDFNPVFGMISVINDIYQLGNGNIINYLNFAYSLKINNEYKNRKYEACKFIAEVLGEPPVDQLPTPPTEPSDETKDEESSKTETPSTEEPTSSKTSEGTPEAEPAKEEEPVDETEKKDETPSSENANQNIDIKYDGNWVIINGKPVPYSEEDGDNIERKWPDEDNETANKLITGLINRGESPSEAINDINDLWEYGSRDGNIINFLNGVYSSRNRLDNPKDLEIRTECYNKCKIMAEILGEPPVDELPKPDSVEKPSDDIKKISDTTGLDEGKVESIYKLLKDNTTPDAIKRALIIDTISPMMHMSGFNEVMANKSFATNYANFKKVAEAANMPFEIELPKISEKDINNIHTIVDGAGTDETKIAKIADNLMNSASAEKKAEIENPENEILNTADTIENANQDQNKPPTQVTSDDLIAAKNANINETIAERIAYAINNNKDITSGVVVPVMGMLLDDINERPLNLFEQSQYLKTYNDLVKAFNYFHLDPNQYLDPEKYPDPKSLGILSDEERAEQDRRNTWLVDLATELMDYLSDNKTIAEFISDKKISETDVADALKHLGINDISVPIDENKVRKALGISELKTQAAPKAQPSSPSNSSTGSRAGSNQ